MPGQPGAPPDDAGDEPPSSASEPPDAPPPAPPPRPRDAVVEAHRVHRRVIDRTPYLRLDLGESSAPASPHVLAAIRDLTEPELARYPDPRPLQELLADLHGVPVDSVLITAGSDEAIRQVFYAYVEEGARVVIPRPTFGAFVTAADIGGAFSERVDCEEDGSLSPDAFRRALGKGTPRLAVISLPDAPTGKAMDTDDVLALAHEAPETLFLVNESFAAYHGLTLLTGAPLPANILVLRSFSKDYGLAGLRVGYLIGHPRVLSAIDLVRPSYTVSAGALAGACAALQDPESMRRHVLGVRAAMDRLVAKLRIRGIGAVATSANFVLIRLTAPIQPWAAGFAARGVLVGTAGHVGPLSSSIRVTVNDDHEIDTFLDALDLLLRHGLQGASEVKGVPGDWEDPDSEGLA
jgi:histidinol-phosphate aminotransferase